MSKIHLPIVCLAATGVAITAFAQNLTPAKPTAPPGTNAAPVAAPPADPFPRNPGANPPPPVPQEAEPPPVNVLTTLETWSLSQADFAALLDGPADERAPVDRLEALAKVGKAKLLGLQAISTKPGQRAVVETIDELRYATEFKQADRPGELSFPTSYETRNAGETFELEPNIGPDGQTIEVNLVPQTVRLAGFQDWRPEEGAAAVGQPQIQTEKLTTSVTVKSGRPILLSAATPARTGPEANPIRVRVLRATAQPVPPPVTVVPDPLEVRIDLLIYALEREAARRILAETADSAQSYAAVRELVDKGSAQLEVVTSFLNKSGQRAVNEEILEVRYPNRIIPPAYDSQTVPKENRQPASFGGFETRNTGVTMEIETVLGPGARLVNINVVPQVVEFRGMVQPGGAAAREPAQPLFTTRKLTTSATSAAGVPVLLGTMSQPRETGVNERKDDSRTSLAYIRVTPIRP